MPARLAPLYVAAAARHKLGGNGPSILAAINEVETGFGRDLGTSSTGAIGWMQFEPSSWAAYGVDANGDGRTDPYEPADAIFAAANLLRAAGAPGDWRAAIFTYNHAGWYVAKVLAEARRFAESGGSTQLAGFTGCAAAALAPNEAIARMLAEAARLSALRPRSSYVWGGSHGASPTPPNGPFDCSSAVSHLLQVAGFRNPTMDTVALARTWAGEMGDDLRQALRPGSPHLPRLQCRTDAAGRALLGNLGHRRAWQGAGLDRRRQVLSLIPGRIRDATSAWTLRGTTWTPPHSCTSLATIC